MTFQDFLDALSRFDTDGMLAYLGQYDIGAVINNPWYLGIMGVLAVVCLIFKWRLLLATIVGITGLAWLISYTVQRGAEIEGNLQSQNLLVFVGGGVVVIGLMIYLLFIKGD